MASDQSRHEALLKSRTSFRTFWRRLRPRMRSEPQSAQALARNSPAEDTMGTDMKAVVIRSYLEELGPLKAALSYSTLATACQYALEGRGPPDLQDQAIATITWQSVQLQEVGRVLNHLAKQGLIGDIVDKETADQALVDHLEDIVSPIAQRIDETLGPWKLTNPPKEGHVDVFFNDARGWLIDTLAYNQLKYPDEFDLDRVESEVLALMT